MILLVAKKFTNNPREMATAPNGLILFHPTSSIRMLELEPWKSKCVIPQKPMSFRRENYYFILIANPNNLAPSSSIPIEFIDKWSKLADYFEFKNEFFIFFKLTDKKQTSQIVDIIY